MGVSHASHACVAHATSAKAWCVPTPPATGVAGSGSRGMPLLRHKRQGVVRAQRNLLHLVQARHKAGLRPAQPLPTAPLQGSWVGGAAMGPVAQALALCNMGGGAEKESS